MQRRLLATAILAIGVPAGAAAYVGARTRVLAAHLSAAAQVPARVGSVDADLTGTVRLSDIALGEIVKADSIEGSVGLESLLAGELDADELRVASPRVAIAIDRDGDSDLARVVRRLARPRTGAGGGPAKLRRIIVTSGALTAKIADVGELEADRVELVPDAGGVRVITGRIRARGTAGRLGGELELERGAAEVELPHARFGRVLAVAGTGALAIDGTRALALRDVALGRLAAGGVLELHAVIDDGGARRPLVLKVSPDALAIRGDHVPLASLAPLAPHGVDLAAARATGELVLHRDRIQVAGAIDDLRLDHRAVSAEPIAISPRVTGTLRVTPESFAVDGTLALGTGPEPGADRSMTLGGNARVAGSGWLRRGSPMSGQLDVRIEPTPCSELLAAMPAELRGPLDGMALTGTFGGRARVVIDLAAPTGEGVALDTTLANDCEVTAEPPAADVTTLAKRDPAWFELKRLPAYVSRAFLAAEDSRFYDHHGFDPREIARSLEIDLRDHRLARGGSTISQQLVKNSFLTQRRSLDRKIQEAILTWRLEARLDKKAILERYLNIIELGPRVFGVDAAARHWFGETARELSVRQAAFLAALTAEPQSMSRRVRHAGGLDADSAARVDVVLHAMHREGALDKDELAAARDAGMHFAASALKRDD
jgi:hypothetical protein